MNEHERERHDHDHPVEPEGREEREALELEVEAFGPTSDDAAELQETFLAHPAIRSVLENSEFRLLSFRIDDDGGKRASPCPPDRFFATLYDYTNGRTLRATGGLDALEDHAPGDITIEDVADEPIPSAEEFAAAVEILRHDRELRAILDDGRTVPYAPMPPVISTELPDGRIDRGIAVGLRTERGDSIEHRIVAVNMFSRRIDYLDRFHWPDQQRCEPPPAAENCGSSGSTGQVTVNVWQGGQKIWSFVVVRPAASSGTNGSGVELRYVDYKGKRVLYRAHVPILNVEYPGGQCGPTYRDWQNAEACFQANGTDVIPGFRVCTSPPTTILDSGVDAGNFRGVAIYVDGQDVVLVSELTAGWYRYISHWRLSSNGVIKPMFGFGATDNPCTCNEHVHHAYWRLDFDIRTAWNNVVEEFNDPPIVSGTNWHAKTYEIRRLRDASRKRRWRVSNASTREGYELIPGADDGVADAYGVGDLWVLKYRGTELDDGQGFTSNAALSRARIDDFKSPAELVSGGDAVLWYVGHFRHDLAHSAGHRVGPTLRPVNW